jgi:esterase/lipase superfamily enzyme
MGRGFHGFAVLILVFVMGCAPRGAMVFAPSPTGTQHEILVGTTRLPLAGGVDFGRGRSADLSFASYTVAVPPSHEPGQVEWPDATPDPAQDFVITDHQRYANAPAFSRAVAAKARALPSGQREAVIFVHGYNTNMAEGLYRFTQMQHDFELPSIPILYSWPSAASGSDYLYDRDSILFARSGLETLINQISRTPVERIVLVGHSMGAQLLMEALRQRVIRTGALWPKLRMVNLIAPDLDIDLFHAQARDIGRLPQPFVVFTSGRDRALQFSQWLSGSDHKLGTVENLDQLADLDITVVDTTAIGGAGVDPHLTAVTSPWMISVLKGLQGNRRFNLDRPALLAGLPLRIVSNGRAVGLVLGP